jgi:hypothetical protein
MIITRYRGQMQLIGAAVGATEFAIQQPDSGATSAAAVRLMNDAGTVAYIVVGSSNRTDTGLYGPHRTTLEALGTGGLVIRTTNAAGVIWMGCFGGQQLVMRPNAHDSLILNEHASLAADSTLSNYNGLLIGSNISTWNSGSAGSYGTQKNTGLVSWAIDVGGRRGGDGAPFGADMFAIYRRPAAGSWARLVGVDSAGTVTAPKFQTGDIELDNQFIITEHDKVGIKEPGVAIVSSAGDVVAFVDSKGTIYARRYERLSDLFARSRT